jgi:hypothetical protein
LEAGSISKRLSWESDSSLVDVPLLVLSISAVVVGKVIVVSVLLVNNRQALLTVVLDVSVSTRDPSGFVVDGSGVLGDDGGDTDSPVCSSLVHDAVGSLAPWSDGVGSAIEGPPLLSFGIIWVVVSDSESVLVTTDVFMPEDSSVGFHSRSDLELNTVSQWVSWVLNALGVNDPSLMVLGVAVFPGDVSSV